MQHVIQTTIEKLAGRQWQTSALVLLVAAIGMIINVVSIPFYTALYSFEEWGLISLEFVYFNFFSILGAFAINIYLFHSDGQEDRMVAARIIYILWLTLAFTCITILWPRNDLQRFLAYAQLGLISSLAIFKSGIEWQQNRFISQRLWLLLPVLIFHVYTILNHSFLIELPFLDIILLSTGILGLVYVVFIGWVNRDSIKKNARIILSFSLPMMLNLALTAGVELKMKTTLQASLSGREWSVFSLGSLLRS